MASLYFSSPEGPPAKQAEGDLVLTGPRHQLTVAVKRGRLDEFRVIFEGGELDKLREWLMPAPVGTDEAEVRVAARGLAFLRSIAPARVKDFELATWAYNTIKAKGDTHGY